MAIDISSPRSRRSLITAALAGAAAAAAATLTGAQRVLAAGSDGTPVLVAGVYDDARNETVIVNNTNNQNAFRAGSNQGGDGVQGFSNAGSGVSANSYSGSAVYGKSDHGTGVQGVSGDGQRSSGYPAAVLGEATLPAGVSILGNNYATSGTAQGVQGTSDSPAGFATTGWARHGGTGIIGVVGATFPPVPARTGVYGFAPGGRGVVAGGGAAQVRLLPSAAVTHPTNGQLGDLFLDKAGRLWFCKGATTWKQLA